MYEESEMTALLQQVKKRWILTLVPVAVLAAGLVFSVVRRSEVPAVVLSVLIGAVLIFSWDCMIRPVKAYAAHVDRALHGRRHETEGGWGGLEEETSAVNGVQVRAVSLHCFDEKHKPYDRLFYWDALKEPPVFEEGERVRVTYTDRQVIGIAAAGEARLGEKPES